MTLKELAHAAQQSLQTPAGCDVKRSHVHEPLAAVFSHSSWAAFLSESVPADGRALTKGDALRAWTWQYLALAHGVDLTESTMAAYHDGW